MNSPKGTAHCCLFQYSDAMDFLRELILAVPGFFVLVSGHRKRASMKIGLLIFSLIGFCLTGCMRSEVSWLSAPRLPGFQKPGQKPNPGDEDFVRLIWTYKDSRAEDADMSDISVCDGKFALDEDCSVLNQLCRRNHNIYACYPEDGIMLFRGFVLDEKGRGISGANVHLGIPAGGYSDLVRTVTKDDGSFIIRTSGICYNWGYAHKTGYVDATGYQYSRVAFGCSFENWGVKGIVFPLFSLGK